MAAFELRSDAKASSKGYRPRFKLVHPERTITFEVPSGGVPFGEIKEAGALPIRYLVFRPEFGLLSSSEDGYVSSCGDLKGATAGTIGAASPSQARERTETAVR